MRKTEGKEQVEKREKKIDRKREREVDREKGN